MRKRSNSLFVSALDVEALEQVMHDADRFEACIAAARAKAPGSVEGFFGPGSMVWRMFGELAINAGGFRAVAMQISHPAVAAAGIDSERFRHGFLLRSLRSFGTVSEMAFGDVETAVGASRRLHVLHSMVRGTISPHVGERNRGKPYRANDEPSLLWVLATLFEASVFAHDRFIGPLSLEERARYYDEVVLLGLLHGIPESAMPGSLAEFESYWQQMLAHGLETGPAARELIRQVRSSTPWRTLTKGARSPLSWLDDAWLAGTIPEEAGERLGLRFTPGQRRFFDGVCAVCRAVLSVTPMQLRLSPAHHQGILRVAVAGNNRGPLLSRLVDRVNARVTLPFSLRPVAILAADAATVHDDLFGG